MPKVECSWCHNKDIEESAAREVSFLGRTFILCDEDFQLIWRGFAGINALCEQFKAIKAAGTKR
jgi:hypothetical protein